MDEAEVCLHCKRPECRNCLGATNFWSTHAQKPVRQIDPQTKVVICEYATMMEAATEFKIETPFIWACCSGSVDEIAGYIWEVIQEDNADE